MPLIRGHHSFDDQFAQIPNAWLRDARLSLKAIGLLAQIMTHVPGWNMSINSLAQRNNVGRDQIRTAIQELEEFGYLTREQSREDGKFSETIWRTSDPTEIPLSENSTTVNPTTKNTITKEEQIKNNERIYSDSENEFESFWSHYPKKVDKGAAVRAFRKALKTYPATQVIEGAKRYAEDPNLPEKQFIKNPATWLNAESWNNGPLPARKKTDRKALEEWAND
jgi:predicted transcriptional regulator